MTQGNTQEEWKKYWSLKTSRILLFLESEVSLSRNYWTTLLYSRTRNGVKACAQNPSSVENSCLISLCVLPQCKYCSRGKTHFPRLVCTRCSCSFSSFPLVCCCNPYLAFAHIFHITTAPIFINIYLLLFHYIFKINKQLI